MGWVKWYVPQHLIEGQEGWAHLDVQPVRALLAKGADVGLTDKDGLTALHHAAHSDYNVEIAQILLEHGPISTPGTLLAKHLSIMHAQPNSRVCLNF
jgi:ankyrin repeat protein